MGTHVPGFQSLFLGVLHHFVFAKLATSSIRGNRNKVLETFQESCKLSSFEHFSLRYFC